jgi:hypothetical protein
MAHLMSTANASSSKDPGGKHPYRRLAALILTAWMITSLASACSGLLDTIQLPGSRTLPGNTGPSQSATEPYGAPPVSGSPETEETQPQGDSSASLSAPADTPDPENDPEPGELPDLPNASTPPASPDLKSTSDLLYITDQRLMRWDHMTGYTVALVDNVVQFKASASGKRVALLRTRGIAANGVALYDLAIFDFYTMQVHTLIENIPRLEHLSISPDDRWIIYSSPDEGNRLYALNVEAPEQQLALGECHIEAGTRCTQVSWAPNSQTILWSDVQGLWLSGLDQTTPRLIQPDRVQITDPQAKSIEIEVRYQNMVWSPDGRYVLTEVLPQDSEISWYAIADTRRERLVQVHDSYKNQGSNAAMIWLQDGSLLMIHAGDPSSQAPLVRQWQLVHTHNELLILNQEFVLSSEAFPAISQPGLGHSYGIYWLTQSSQEQCTLAINHPDTALASGVFSLDLVEGTLQKLFDLPPEVSGVLWSPDGSGALILGEDESNVLFVSRLGGVQQDLRSLLGQDAHDFTWLPPTPRSIDDDNDQQSQ